MEASETRLLEILGGIAMYNDKGFEWSRHSLVKIERERKKAFNAIQMLLHEMGEHKFPEELLQLLRSRTPVNDSSGQYKQAVAAFLSSHPSA